ncbi:FAD:protein FMN transferase [Haloferax chudinovii]|uniref:FAD:protein FMN transferase n=1 Tax=Haloferax chudinovii TaxID=1109010 RepID=A0ABD5X9L8_9EURY
MTTDIVSRARSALGESTVTFDCCDTAFLVRAVGRGAPAAARRARDTARDLERVLDAFDSRSAVSRLNRTGRIDDATVAAVVRRGLEYRERTDGAFDIGAGATEARVKEYIAGDSRAPPDGADPTESAQVAVDGTTVEADGRLDLNGLAKGFIVDRAAAELDGFARTGFVDGGGDISAPTGPVAVESPFGGDRPLRVLDTSWNVATSSGHRRGRGGVDHIYDPRGGRVGTRHDLVTVVARRDCTEADALATTLGALPLADALSLAEGWSGLEAFVVHDGVFHATTGFSDHVA